MKLIVTWALVGLVLALSYHQVQSSSYGGANLYDAGASSSGYGGGDGGSYAVGGSSGGYGGSSGGYGGSSGGDGYGDGYGSGGAPRPRIKLNLGVHIPAMKIQMPKMNMPKITIRAKVRQPNRPMTIFVPEIQLDSSSKLPGPEGSRAASLNGHGSDYGSGDSGYSSGGSSGGYSSGGPSGGYSSGGSGSYGAASAPSYGTSDGYQGANAPSSYAPLEPGQTLLTATNDNYDGATHLSMSSNPPKGGNNNYNNNNNNNNGYVASSSDGNSYSSSSSSGYGPSNNAGYGHGASQASSYSGSAPSSGYGPALEAPAQYGPAPASYGGAAPASYGGAAPASYGQAHPAPASYGAPGPNGYFTQQGDANYAAGSTSNYASTGPAMSYGSAIPAQGYTPKNAGAYGAQQGAYTSVSSNAQATGYNKRPAYQANQQMYPTLGAAPAYEAAPMPSYGQSASSGYGAQSGQSGYGQSAPSGYGQRQQASSYAAPTSVYMPQSTYENLMHAKSAKSAMKSQYEEAPLAIDLSQYNVEHVPASAFSAKLPTNYQMDQAEYGTRMPAGQYH